jgi:hypothetical protein
MTNSNSTNAQSTAKTQEKQQTQQAHGTGARPSTSSKSGSTMQTKLKHLGEVTRWIFITGMGFLLIINAQPWMELAARIAPTLTKIPFIGSLVKLPFLGGWIQWALGEIVSILGTVLCVTIQIVEILPMMVEGSVEFKRKLNTYRWIAYAIEFCVCFMRFPPYQGGTPAFFEDFLQWDWYLIDWWNLIFFLVTMTGFEICVGVALTILQGMAKTSKA